MIWIFWSCPFGTWRHDENDSNREKTSYDVQSLIFDSYIVLKSAMNSSSLHVYFSFPVQLSRTRHTTEAQL